MAREIRIRGIADHQKMESSDDSGLFVQTVEWDRTLSMQCIAADLGLAAGAGASSGTQYLAAIMGNVVMGTTTTNVNLTGTANIIAGVIGKYDHIGTNASTYPSSAVRGEIGDGSTAARAAFLAVMGGDTATTSASAAFGVDWNNSTAGSLFTYGLDLEGPAAHDSYVGPRYNAYVRIGGRLNNAGTVETVADLCILAGTAAPTNGTSGTGAGVAGAGSLYIRQSGSNSKIYINGNTLASPTWNLVTSA